MPGYRTAMGYLPERDVAFAIQVNTDGRGVGSLERVALDVVGLLAAEREAGDG